MPARSLISAGGQTFVFVERLVGQHEAAVAVAAFDEVGLAHLDCHEEFPDWAGIHQNNGLVGAAAVDMLVAQLHRNEFGLPKYSKASFIQGTWIDGPTIARRAARKNAPAAGKPSEASRETAAA